MRAVRELSQAFALAVPHTEGVRSADGLRYGGHLRAEIAAASSSADSTYNCRGAAGGVTQAGL